MVIRFCVQLCAFFIRQELLLYTHRGGKKKCVGSAFYEIVHSSDTLSVSGARFVLMDVAGVINFFFLFFFLGGRRNNSSIFFDVCVCSFVAFRIYTKLYVNVCVCVLEALGRLVTTFCRCLYKWMMMMGESHRSCTVHITQFIVVAVRTTTRIQPASRRGIFNCLTKITVKYMCD